MYQRWTETQCTRRVPGTLSNDGMKQRYTRVVLLYQYCAVSPLHASYPAPFSKVQRYMMYTPKTLFFINRMLNKSNEKCTKKKGGVVSAPPSPLVPSIYSQYLGGKSKKTGRERPRIPGSVHPPPTRVNARRRNKGQKASRTSASCSGGGWYGFCGVVVYM